MRFATRFLLIIAIISIATFTIISCKQTIHTADPQPLKLSAHEANIKNGQKLALSICGPCHFEANNGTFSGKKMEDVPKMLGTIVASDITKNSARGIGKYYSMEEMSFLIRTGIMKNGHYSPFMARPNISDADLMDIYAFLTSEDPMVQTGDPQTIFTEYSGMAKAVIGKMKPQPYQSHIEKGPSPEDKVAYGKYLVDVIGCYDCHSGNINKVDRINIENSNGFFGGGSKFRGMDGKAIHAANLTPDEATGIAHWSEKDFVKAIREGITPEKRILKYPMPIYNALSEEDAAAIYAYLRTIAPIKKKVKRSAPIGFLGDDKGAKLYQKYSCTGCHGTTGKGVGDLRKAYTKYSDTQIIELLRNPKKYNPNTTMPSFDGLIKEDDYPVLVEYVKKLGKKAFGEEKA